MRETAVKQISFFLEFLMLYEVYTEAICIDHFALLSGGA